MPIILLSLATLAAFAKVREVIPKTAKECDAGKSCVSNADLSQKLEVELGNDEFEPIGVDLPHARFMRLRADIVDKKCAMQHKIFAKKNVSLDSCALHCKDIASCAFISISQSDFWCVGCTSEPTKKSAHTKTYQLGTVEKIFRGHILFATFFAISLYD